MAIFHIFCKDTKKKDFKELPLKQCKWRRQIPFIAYNPPKSGIFAALLKKTYDIS